MSLHLVRLKLPLICLNICFIMSKKVISSLSVEDLKVLSDMASYLLSLHGRMSVSSFHSAIVSKYNEFFLLTESVVFCAEEIAVLKKLKHLHVVEYGK